MPNWRLGMPAIWCEKNRCVKNKRPAQPALLGYVQQSREEMEVLFTLLAERYERGSVLLTSNLAFSKWDQIFKDAMTTAAAIDRLVHHSVILELNVPSYRVETAKEAKSGKDSQAPSER